MNTNEYNELLGKLAVNIANTNNEGIIRANAIATVTGRINALEKITAEDFAELSTKIDKLKASLDTITAQLAGTMSSQLQNDIGLARSVADLALRTAADNKRDLEALKAQNDAVALSTRQDRLESVLTQLIQALADEEEAGDQDDETGLPDDLSALIGGHTMGHSLEEVKTAYLKIVQNDETTKGLMLIEGADIVRFDGETYRLINSTADLEWTLPADIVAELLDGGAE